MAKPVKIKVGSVVSPRWVVAPPGQLSLSVDTRCVVREVRKRDRRVCVDREDGRGTGYWLDLDAVRVWGFSDLEVSL